MSPYPSTRFTPVAVKKSTRTVSGRAEAPDTADVSVEMSASTGIWASTAYTVGTALIAVSR